ncbi:FxLYD domain-containing protein [Kitasatospora sp. NPDC085879]|uniref:FxLYD domain-containing protein n=1 Tax=Kitasatospora sp. NPDC085879 TaxID=3154769 RepID=UPI003415A754
MNLQIRSAAVLGAAVVLGGAALTGCSSDSSPSSVASSAAAAIESKASELASSAGGLASSAASAVASAEAAASSAVADITGGLDATADVKLGTPVTSSDGKLEVPITVSNTQSDPQKYVVQVDFQDSSGNRLDTVAVTVPDVPAGGTAQATAQSNRALTGQVKATVARALRY